MNAHVLEYGRKSLPPKVPAEGIPILRISKSTENTLIPNRMAMTL